MTYGIAAYKVTPEFCQDEVDFIMSIGGIEIKYNHELGNNSINETQAISITELQKQFDAVYLGIGVGLANKLNIPGEDLEGVEDAITFIYNLRSKSYPEISVGDKVAVIGMGMTAIDAATQAKRLGAKEVTMVYRRTEAEKNCTQFELDLAKLDGCKMLWLAAPKEIIGEQARPNDSVGQAVGRGKVKALVCDVMKLGAPDYSGKPAPEPTGKTITLEVDMVIKATGQRPFSYLVEESQIKNVKGKIVIDSNCATNLKGVFAGGDAVNGGKEVVDAVQAGKDGAAAILKYLQLC